MREKGNKPSLILRAIGNVLTSKLFLGALAAAAILTAIGFGVSSQLTRESKTTRFGFEDIGELATQSAYCTEVSVISVRGLPSWSGSEAMAMASTTSMPSYTWPKMVL